MTSRATSAQQLWHHVYPSVAAFLAESVSFTPARSALAEHKIAFLNVFFPKDTMSAASFTITRCQLMFFECALTLLGGCAEILVDTIGSFLYSMLSNRSTLT